MVYNNSFVLGCLGKAEGWLGDLTDLAGLSQMSGCHVAVSSGSGVTLPKVSVSYDSTSQPWHVFRAMSEA